MRREGAFSYGLLEDDIAKPKTLVVAITLAICREIYRRRTQYLNLARYLCPVFQGLRRLCTAFLLCK